MYPFNDKFKERNELVKQLLFKYLPHGWKFKNIIPLDDYWKDFDDKLIGRCNFENKEISISLRWFHILDDEDFTKAVLHEIAHALAGAEHGHDETWREVYDRLLVQNRLDLYGINWSKYAEVLLEMKERGLSHFKYNDQRNRNAYC